MEVETVNAPNRAEPLIDSNIVIVDKVAAARQRKLEHRSLAENLMNAIGEHVYENGNFLVVDMMERDFPISFVSRGFSQLTG